MAKRSSEFDKVLGLAAKVDPATGKRFSHANIARLLDMKPGTVGMILRRNGLHQKLQPVLPPIEELDSKERALLIGISAGGVPGEVRRWFSSHRLAHVVIEQRISRYRTDPLHELNRASDVRRRYVIANILPRYGDVRDEDQRTIAYMDPKVFRFMVNPFQELDDSFFKSVENVAPFTLGLVAAGASKNMHIKVDDVEAAEMTRQSLKDYFDVPSQLRTRTGRAGNTVAELHIYDSFQQRLWEGLVGSSSVRGLPYFSDLFSSGHSRNRQANVLPSTAITQTNGNNHRSDEVVKTIMIKSEIYQIDPFFTNFEEQTRLAEIAARNLGLSLPKRGPY